MTATPNPGRERGFALLIVLWTLVLLSLLVTHVAATGRREAEIAGNLRANAGREAAVDGAVFESAFRALGGGGAAWAADGVKREITVGGHRVIVAVSDPANLVNLNTATGPLLRALLVAVGANEAEAGTLAAAIIDWRERGRGPAATAAKRQRYLAAGLNYAPPEAPFRSVGELRLVVGVSPALLARLAPHVTVWSTFGPVVTTPDPLVRAALERLRDEGGDLPDQDNDEESRVLVISAGSADGTARQRLAALRFDLGDRNRPCAILAWQDEWLNPG
ncbi:MAG: general secretion pathway protein GspK [Acetobacteraceae bacterium]|nr:general secretion pathway protein GspK [Acetobacteraceae bacterium]